MRDGTRRVFAAEIIDDKHGSLLYTNKTNMIKKNALYLVAASMLLVAALCLIYENKVTDDDATRNKEKEGGKETLGHTAASGKDSRRNASHTGRVKNTKSKLEDLRKQVALIEDSAPDPECLRLQLAYEFADQDPDAGFAWVKSLDPTGPHARNMMTAFAIRLGIKGSDKWKLYLDDLRPGALKDSFLSSAVIGVAHNDAVKAWREYQAIADVAWNREVTDKQVFDRLAQANPEQFWQIVQELKRNEEDTEQAKDYEADFFTYAVFEDKQMAVNLLDAVGDADKKRQYVKLYLKGLHREQLVEFGDAVAAGSFQQKEKDSILYDISNRVYSRDLGGGARLATSIKDENLRQKLTTQIKLHAQRQGPDIEERITKILSDHH